ncbi:putative allantoate permease [Escherichia phage IMM-002]|uniref:Putative allantoate permease n=1 Tax=Escherichia phage IMM-002 TaxID=2041760 RepID=A0A384WII9_9CAUD|nr:putative allantoate permease [Escherichia phage IMM-002]ATI17011.1 putative allantoate permease [Escherichia phage IMM-002]
MLTPVLRIARPTDDLVAVDSFLTFRSLIPLVSLVSAPSSAPMSTLATSSLRGAGSGAAVDGFGVLIFGLKHIVPPLVELNVVLQALTLSDRRVQSV